MAVLIKSLHSCSRVEGVGDRFPLSRGDCKIQLVSNADWACGRWQGRYNTASIGKVRADDDRCRDAQRLQGSDGNVVSVLADDTGNTGLGQALVGASPSGRNGGVEPQLKMKGGIVRCTG